jgi:hypothetical protein
MQGLLAASPSKADARRWQSISRISVRPSWPNHEGCAGASLTLPASFKRNRLTIEQDFGLFRRIRNACATARCHATVAPPDRLAQGDDNTLLSRITYHQQPWSNECEYHQLLSSIRRCAPWRQSPETFCRWTIGRKYARPQGNNERSASRKNAIRVDASHVCNRANARFGVRTVCMPATAVAPSPWPAPHIAHELFEATPL